MTKKEEKAYRILEEALGKLVTGQVRDVSEAVSKHAAKALVRAHDTRH